MRSAREIAFRLRQECANLLLYALPPRGNFHQPAPLPALPDPAIVASHLRGTPFADNIVRLAGMLLEHRFPLFGTVIETGPTIDWRRDYVHGRSSGTSYFRLIPYLDFERAGDHKVVWELNRHQHLVVLAQAFCLTDEPAYVREIVSQLEGWLQSNPYGRGLNWASALEVAFRALSWIWVYHLAGSAFPAPFREAFLRELYRHGCYLEHNLSFYFSPNTHLLGEAVALHALGRLFPAFPSASRWETTGAAVARAQMDLQVRGDGSHFEQSTYYHVYALDLFLLHRILSGPLPGFDAKLERMAEYLDALLGPSAAIPLIGDDDGGRVFHPYGERNRFGRATLAACAALLGRHGWHACAGDLHELAFWWMGPCSLDSQPVAAGRSRLFADAGVAVMCSGAVHAVIDAGPFGPGGAGHSHSDTLSLVVRDGAEDLLIDPATYTYVADPAARDRFRGSAAHNTITVDGQDQAVPVNAFRWGHQPRVELLEWATAPDHDLVDARCQCAAFEHRRRILFIKPGLFLILDELQGPAGEHTVEQFWHTGENASAASPRSFRIGAHGWLAVAPPGEADLSTGGDYGWRSPVFGQRVTAPVVRLRRKTTFPAVLATAVECSATCASGDLSLEHTPAGALLRFERPGRKITAVFTRDGGVEWTSASQPIR